MLSRFLPVGRPQRLTIRWRVLLVGENGDDVVSQGAGCLAELLFSFKWRIFLRELNGFAQRVNAPRRRILWHTEILPALGDIVHDSVLAAQRRLHRWSPSSGRSDVIAAARGVNLSFAHFFCDHLWTWRRAPRLHGTAALKMAIVLTSAARQ